MSQCPLGQCSKKASQKAIRSGFEHDGGFGGNVPKHRVFSGTDTAIQKEQAYSRLVWPALSAPLVEVSQRNVHSKGAGLDAGPPLHVSGSLRRLRGLLRLARSRVAPVHYLVLQVSDTSLWIAWFVAQSDQCRKRPLSTSPLLFCFGQGGDLANLLLRPENRVIIVVHHKSSSKGAVMTARDSTGSATLLGCYERLQPILVGGHRCAHFRLVFMLLIHTNYSGTCATDVVEELFYNFYRHT